MNDRDFERLGIPRGPLRGVVAKLLRAARERGFSEAETRAEVSQVVADPRRFSGHQRFGALADALAERAEPAFEERASPAPFLRWGKNIEETSLAQMRNACRLPVAVRGAIMPDAHPGYGLPIGGVLATRGAVIPYAVGVDIACRMKLTVLDLPPSALDERPDALARAIESETRFGVGAHFERRRQHAVMDRDWEVTPVTRKLKDKAWAQLGTSGSGNHFVEFGVLTCDDRRAGLPAGDYLALLSHSGSRGSGAAVASHYSTLARERHRELPRELVHLAWLDLESDAGGEYWGAMELMGEYAAANHACIHRHLAEHLGAGVLLEVENHHNFAWRERHDGEELIVHRKGATPAGAGVPGVIPGSMADHAYLVRGKGGAGSLDSAAHGAGRLMSRTEASRTFTWEQAREVLRRKRVRLLSAGLDEVPMVYKNIETVMAEQQDLVEVLARFAPRLVKMAPAGERPED